MPVSKSEVFTVADFLKGKNILIISPQAWGTMFLAKHHYAVELARRGNQVYFLNPPALDRISLNSPIQIKNLESHPNLHLIDHSLFFPGWLRFKILWLFHTFMYFHVRKIKKQLPTLDIVWSFDLAYYYPFNFWDKKALKLYHPIDEPSLRFSIPAARGASLILSVTQEILAKFAHLSIPGYFLHHGVSASFLEHANPVRQANKPLHCGFSGNLTRADLDRTTFLKLVRQYPEVCFSCWGSYQAKDSNIAGDDSADLRDFISNLKSMPNVTLHGAVTPEVLAQELHNMDLLLICYDIERDQSKGTNYHKVMEYLSTGKVILANNISTYVKYPELITMCQSRQNNDELPEIFGNVIANINAYNSPEKQRRRIEFARENLYSKQLDKIEVLLQEVI